MSIVQPTYQVEWAPAGSFVDISQYMISADILVNTSTSSTAVAFGEQATPRTTIEVSDDIAGAAWELTPIRVFLGTGGSNILHFSGVVASRSRNDRTITLECEGFTRLMANRRGYSPLFRNRPIATETTISSIEDPANPLYHAGLINWLFWQTGGRPLDQSGTYPNAAFYYACDRSLLTPAWTWANGERALDELYRLARAGGGQIYQDKNGVMRYIEPLTLASAAATATYTDAEMHSISERAVAEETIGTVRCPYTRRVLQPLQQIYEDATPIQIDNGQSETIVIETQWPIWAWGTVTVSAVDGGGQAVTPTVAFVSQAAQRAEIRVTNSTGGPIVLYKMVITGQPVGVVQSGIESFGSGMPERELEDNPYIQNRSAAQRLCRLSHDFYRVTRPIRTLNCGFDSARFVGETIHLTYSPWGLNATPHRIISRQDGNGATMDLDCVPIGGLPVRDDFFIIGQSYAGGDTRQWGY
ncbi:MAG: hypothetical protein MI924_10690 [Chloroflexales bacterium]|nr:hypothetical protein [Chloroflexales bacterium]